MAARESAAVLAALADHLAGMSQVAAAKKHGVNRSSIGRALLRRQRDAAGAARLAAVASSPTPPGIEHWLPTPPT